MKNLKEYFPEVLVLVLGLAVSLGAVIYFITEIIVEISKPQDQIILIFAIFAEAVFLIISLILVRLLLIIIRD